MRRILLILVWVSLIAAAGLACGVFVQHRRAEIVIPPNEFQYCY